MKLSILKVKNYRSLRDVSIELEDFNLFIGANATGKSTILDTLRFLHEAVHARDFEAPMFTRGGILNLAWKGEQAHQIDLAVTLEDGEDAIEWSVQITRHGYHYHVEERVERCPPQSPPIVLLEADAGTGWWWSNTTSQRVNMRQPATACALAAAAADASFPARGIADFIRRWGFFDPSPFLLRRDWTGVAWYFADAESLRRYLERDLGNVDGSRPDEIENPKLRLKNILDRVYTARVSEEIARALDAETIARRSPSFKGFLDALLNGVAHASCEEGGVAGAPRCGQLGEGGA